MAEELNNQTNGTEGTEGASQGNNQGNNTATGDAGSSNSGVKTFTQAEVDTMIKERLARERKKYAQQGTNNTAEGTTEGQTADTQGTGTNQVEVDVTEDARQQAAAIIAQANQRLIQSIALAEATKLNINPSYVADAVRLADLSKVVVNDDGTVDTKSVTTALEAVLERMPVLKTAAEAPAGGFKVGGQGGNNNTTNGWNNNAQKGTGETKRWNKNRY